MEKETGEKSGFEKILIRIAAVIAALGVIISGIIAVINFVPINADSVKATLAALNLITLIIYCYFSTKIPKLEFSEGPENKSKYCELLNIELDDKTKTHLGVAEGNAIRVRLLAEQLHTHITWYATFLIVVYILYFFDSKFWFNSLFPGKDYYKYVHWYFDIAIGICNYLSAVFLFLAFKVLYDKTISNDNKTPIRYYTNALIFSVLFLLGYIIFSVFIVTTSLQNDINTANENLANSTALNLFRLFIGIFNGLVMALLFGRYISMEHSAYIMKQGIYEVGKYNNIIHLCTIYILPIYALAQPLFGSFEITAFGNPRAFANSVFLHA